MIKLENTDVIGWEAAIRGMRNPMNSWKKSDSELGCEEVTGSHRFCRECDDSIYIHDARSCGRGNTPGFVLGLNDYDLMTRLRNAGTDHRKFMRMITVYVDITAPLYWWKEFDTYKVGTVANSCSTMHKIHAKRFEREDFSIEHLDNCDEQHWMVCMDNIISAMNVARDKYLETKDKKYWWQMIQLLPTSYNQKRTVMLNYEVLANMYKSRKNHKLDCWHTFCDWVESLPHSELITGKEDSDD
jgi:hypothetical protein